MGSRRGAASCHNSIVPIQSSCLYKQKAFKWIYCGMSHTNEIQIKCYIRVHLLGQSEWSIYHDERTLMGILMKHLLLTSDLFIHTIASLPLCWFQQPPCELSLTLILYCHFSTLPSSTPFSPGSFHRVAIFICNMHVCVHIRMLFFFFQKYYLYSTHIFACDK